MVASEASDRYHHGDLRRALVAAALELLEAGEDVSLRAVARRAGVSHTAPYHHFPNRRALVAAVAEEGLLALREATLRGVARAPADAALRLLETGVAYVRFAVENPARFRLMFSAEFADRGGLPTLQAAYEGAYGVLLGAVRDLLRPGESETTVETAALRAWSTVHGLSMLLLDNQVAGAGRDPDEAERLTRAVLRGGPPG